MGRRIGESFAAGIRSKTREYGGAGHGERQCWPKLPTYCLEIVGEALGCTTAARREAYRRTHTKWANHFRHSMAPTVKAVKLGKQKLDSRWMVPTRVRSSSSETILQVDSQWQG